MSASVTSLRNPATRFAVPLRSRITSARAGRPESIRRRTTADLKTSGPTGPASTASRDIAASLCTLRLAGACAGAPRLASSLRLPPKACSATRPAPARRPCLAARQCPRIPARSPRHPAGANLLLVAPPSCVDGASAGFRPGRAGHSGHTRFSSWRRAIGELRREVGTVGTVLLPYAPASVGVARQRLAADLIAAGIFAGAVGDAVLVVSELLSNAIRHARPLPGASVQVAWALDDDAVEVAVSDGGALTRPILTQATVSALGGRGLSIVEYLARTWGVRSDDAGLTVWAVLAAPPAPLRATASPVVPQAPAVPQAADGGSRRNSASRSDGAGRRNGGPNW